MRYRKVALGAVALAIAVPVMPEANAKPATVHATFQVPFSISTSVTSDSYCDNTGPHITFKSILSLGGHAAELELIQNVNKVDTVVGSFALDLWNADGTEGDPQIAKQPPLGGVGGNPFMYYRDLSTYGTEDYTGDVYLGRCVQDFGAGNDNGRGPFTNHGSLDAFSDMTVQALTCSNKGSSITFGSSSDTEDPTGMLVLTNNFVDLHGVTPHVNDDEIAASASFTLFNTSLRKGGGRYDGVGGNPKIGLQTGTLADTNGDGNTDGVVVDGVSDLFTTDGSPQQQLGRCNKLY